MSVQKLAPTFTREHGHSQRFAVLIPVGPSPVDLYRGVELVKSLLRWQPSVGWCVILDDSPAPRGLSDLTIFPQHCSAITLVNPRLGRGDGSHGGLFAGIAAALSWLQASTNADFVLKIDTDALVIGPFAESVRSRLVREPDTGVLGAVGFSCNPHFRAMQNLSREPELLRAYRALVTEPHKRGNSLGDSFQLCGVDLRAEQMRSLLAILPHIKSAIGHGYASSEYCQGGAYVITRQMMDRMKSQDYLSCANLWTDLPIGEDMIMAMYTYAVDLRLRDLSGPDEPFGVQAQGLPYSPEILKRLKYSLVHSVKNDRCYSENDIRAFFADVPADKHENDRF
jgi:hypothetical protein